MGDKKYQIFISSTFQDLVEERRKLIEFIMEFGHIPAGMELFSASSMDQLTAIKKIIDISDYYILVLGGRYGSISGNGLSYTELEYDYAQSINIPILCFIHRSPKNIPIGKSDTDPKLIASMQRFRNKVATGRLIKFWDDVNELVKHVSTSLPKAFVEFPRVGWVRNSGDETTIYIKKAEESRPITIKEGRYNELKIEEDIANRMKNIISKYRIPNGEFRIRYSIKNKGGASIVYGEFFIDLSWIEIAIAILSVSSVGLSEWSVSEGLKNLIQQKRPGPSITAIHNVDVSQVRHRLSLAGVR